VVVQELSHSDGTHGLGRGTDRENFVCVNQERFDADAASVPQGDGALKIVP